MSDETALDGRLSLLRGISVFDALDEEALVGLADKLTEEHYAPGAEVFTEGDSGDRLLIIAEGLAELSAKGSVGQIPLATLERGEIVGELALLTSPDRRRNATLAALTPLVLLSLDADRFLELLAPNPRLKAAFDQRADEIATARFIKHVGPLMTLDDQSRRWLANRLGRRTIRTGEALVRQGEAGESCFLLRSGSAQVLIDDGSGEHVVARIDPGSVVGEAALLTEAPRSATVRATEDCEVLELRREDLDVVLANDKAAARELAQLFRLRERPVRDPAVQVSERYNAEGEAITTLKHPHHLTYYRLSERGRFIWDQLDGRHDLRAITLAVFTRFRQFVPHAVADIVAGLARTRMIAARALKPDLDRQIGQASAAERVLAKTRRLLERQLSIRNIDERITRAYDGGVRLIFSWPAQVVLAAIAVSGLVAFVLGAPAAHRALAGHHAQLSLVVIPAFFVAIFLHEAGHAFTVKAFGRQVNRAGIGWYWFAPVAFVDTSDMWLASARQRMVVSAAGPYTNLVLGSVGAIAGAAATSDAATAVLWSIAVPNYLAVLINLNPLLEFDGYHILSDVLDRPNLRTEALRSTAAAFPHLIRDRRHDRRGTTDLLFSIGSVLYVFAMAAVVVVIYRLTVQKWIGTLLPTSVAAAIAWTLAGIVSGLALLGVIADLRTARSGTALSQQRE